MFQVVRSLFVEESGIQHAEEALLLGLIAVAAIAAVTLLKDSIVSVFTKATTSLNGV